MPQCQPCPALITCPHSTLCTSHKEKGQNRGSERRCGADITSSARLGPAHAHSLPVLSSALC